MEMLFWYIFGAVFMFLHLVVKERWPINEDDEDREEMTPELAVVFTIFWPMVVPIIFAVQTIRFLKRSFERLTGKG